MGHASRILTRALLQGTEVTFSDCRLRPASTQCCSQPDLFNLVRYEVLVSWQNVSEFRGRQESIPF